MMRALSFVSKQFSSFQDSDSSSDSSSDEDEEEIKSEADDTKPKTDRVKVKAEDKGKCKVCEKPPISNRWNKPELFVQCSMCCREGRS